MINWLWIVLSTVMKKIWSKASVKLHILSNQQFKPNDFSFPIINSKEKEKILEFRKIEPANTVYDIFCLKQ